MGDKFALLFHEVKVDSLLSGLSESTRTSYKAARIGCGRFCFVRRISVCLATGEQGRGDQLLDSSIWTTRVLGKKASALKGHPAAIRFTHLANGDLDFSLQSHRANAMIKGLEKREGATRK